MHLSTLPAHIPEKIYNRGVNYYYEGAVGTLSVGEGTKEKEQSSLYYKPL